MTVYVMFVSSLSLIASGQCIHDSVQTIYPGLSEAGSTSSGVAVDHEWAAIEDSGRVDLYQFDGLRWQFAQSVEYPEGAPGVSFGSALSLNRDLLAVGYEFDPVLDGTYVGPNRGSVTIFRRTGSEWRLEDRFGHPAGTAEARFGTTVAIAGEKLLVGTWSGSAFAYRFDGTSWQLDREFSDPTQLISDAFGNVVALQGDDAVIGASMGDQSSGFRDSGFAALYRQSAGAWNFLGRLEAPDAASLKNFSTSIGFSGARIVVGAPGDDANGRGAGAAYTFVYDPALRQYIFESKLLKSFGGEGDAFGSSVSCDVDRLVVGAPGANVPVGSACAYQLDGGQWAGEIELIPSGASADPSAFGHTTSQSGDWTFVSAPLWSERASMAGAMFGYQIDELGLDIRPNEIAPGQPVNADVCKGQANMPLILAVVGLNSQLVFLPVATGRFDARGEWSTRWSLPARHQALSGVMSFPLELELAAFGWSAFSSLPSSTYRQSVILK